MLGTTWRMAHLSILCISNHQVAGFCDHHTIFFTFSVVFSNQGFQLQLYLGCWICEALVRLLLWKQSSRWILSSGGHLCCSTSMIYKHNPLQCTALIFGFLPLFLLADDVFPWFVHATLTLETAALDTTNQVTVSLRIHQQNVHQQSVLFETLTFFHLAVLSYKLLLNTICNALKLALHSTNIQKNN